MALVPYPTWLGVGAVALAATWALTRRVPSPSARLALRCLAAAAALTPQPLWIPGEGGALMPALAILVAGGPSVFSLTMGASPIFAVATVLFTLAGWRLARVAGGVERLAHRLNLREPMMSEKATWLYQMAPPHPSARFSAPRLPREPRSSAGWLRVSGRSRGRSSPSPPRGGPSRLPGHASPGRLDLAGRPPPHRYRSWH